MNYYYIMVDGHLRCEKAYNPREACRMAFGVIYDRPTDNARYKNIGRKAPRYLSQKVLQQLKGPNDWLPIPKA